MPAENHTTLTPDTPVRYLKGVGPKTAERFEKLGIVTLADLLPLPAQIYRLHQTLFHRRSAHRCGVRRQGRGVRQTRRAYPAGRAADGAHHCRGRCVQSGDHMVQ